MKNGKCPSCNATTVYRSDNALLRASGSALQLIEPYSELNTHLDPYICCTCGFVSMYVKKTNQLKDLPTAKGWNKVN